MEFRGPRHEHIACHRLYSLAPSGSCSDRTRRTSRFRSRGTRSADAKSANETESDESALRDDESAQELEEDDDASSTSSFVPEFANALTHGKDKSRFDRKRR